MKASEFTAICSDVLGDYRADPEKASVKLCVKSWARHFHHLEAGVLLRALELYRLRGDLYLPSAVQLGPLVQTALREGTTHLKRLEPPPMGAHERRSWAKKLFAVADGRPQNDPIRKSLQRYASQLQRGADAQDRGEDPEPMEVGDLVRALAKLRDQTRPPSEEPVPPALPDFPATAADTASRPGSRPSRAGKPAAAGAK